jgi:RimJ/RimL family protein N-acetyltransferase
MIDRARNSPSGWLGLCILFGAIGGAVGLVVGWASGWPYPLVLVVGAGIGLLLATRALRSPAPTLGLLSAFDQLPDGSAVVRLRHFSEADAHSGALAATVDDEVRRTMGWTAEDAAALVDLAATPHLLRSRGFVAVVDPASDAVLGVVSLTRAGHDDGVLGIWLGPHGRGRGLGGEAVRVAAAMAWGCDVHVLRMGTRADNTAMRRCFVTAGAEVEESGELVLPDGSTVDSVWYRLERPDLPQPPTVG